MSSLLQHRGPINAKGVGILCMKMPKGYPNNEGGHMQSPEKVFKCSKCGKEHGVVYVFHRKPKGMFGCWVVFRYLGKDQIPDLSCPLSLDTLPKGAYELKQSEAEKYWHS